jgi:hypothetical protein
VKGKRWLMIVAAAVLLTGCAHPGSSAQTAPSRVTVAVSAEGATSDAAPSAVRASPIPAPAQSGQASCAQGAKPMPSLDPSDSFDVNDPQQRARRVLAEQHRPTPQRGVVPQAAVPGAEACVYALKLTFSLLTAGTRTVPDRQEIDTALRSAGLTKIVIHPGPSFAASTGAACVYGTFAATGPSFAIGPLASDGSCRP